MKLTPQQQHTLSLIHQFLEDDTTQVFVLLGYAGTGKTTLISEVVKQLEQDERAFKLLATTGRAAKVLQNKTGHAAGTVHGCIYAFDEVMQKKEEEGQAQESGQLQLKFQLRPSLTSPADTVFIIDEASMITHETAGEGHAARFGSGSLLNDLFAFAEKRKIIFVGDPCQLPPIAANPFSSALSPEFLAQEYQVRVAQSELTGIIRQADGSEILDLASPFRQDIRSKFFVKYPKVREPRGKHVSLIRDHIRLQKEFVKKIRGHKYERAVMIGFSNWQVNSLNKYIRKDLYPRWELQERELLMIVQNSYYVQLANGDQVVLEKVSYDSKRAGFTFLKVKVRALHNNQVYESLLIRELLYNQNAGLTRDEVQRLMIDFDKRMRAQGHSRKSKAYKEAMMTDPYLNALRAKFGYAITCHKAQGGEWPEVFLNIHKSVYRMRDAQLYRWYYTALTRAREHLHLNDGWWIAGFHNRRK